MTELMDYYDNYKFNTEHTINEWMSSRHQKKYNVRSRKIPECCGVESCEYTCTICGKVQDGYQQLVCPWRQEYAPYKRMSYFKECITKIQAKQNFEIDDSIITNIKKEISKHNTKIDILTMRTILKKLKYNIHYPNASWIISLIYTNHNIPKFTSELEQLFYCCFQKICRSWNDVKPLTRKTMLSYTYIFRKLCELHIPVYMELFPLPKDINKTCEYDGVWKRLCIIHSWKFVSSFN
jgi:hypothetical protein